MTILFHVLDTSNYPTIPFNIVTWQHEDKRRAYNIADSRYFPAHGTVGQ
ncbi:MAG: hypothetical protein RLZZ161_680, partial [Bacteroidota bacterium]